MADNYRGQSLITKYVWVIETIYRRRKISFKELKELWLRDDISRGVDIHKRTFDNWRYVIWDMFGINIVNENRGEYRYYIENEEDISKNGLRSWLYNTFCVSNALANSQRIKDRIILEHVPSGQDYLQPIIEAMKENRVLNMTYHSYWKDEENNFDVQPYCVKLFRQRWYMVARSTYSYYYEKGPRIYSLDRIKYIHATDETFEMPKDWTAKDFFDGCFGIIPEQSVKIQPVKLKVSAGQANYIRDLKMHESQEEIERNEEYSIFTFNIRPGFDFQQELLWNGEDVEVLEPFWLRKEIAGKIKNTFYSLIQPEPNYYNYWCSQVHALCHEDTDDAPVFPKVWAQIEPVIEGLPLVAHNKPFDESCLKAVFRVYQMDYPGYEFYDTLCVSRLVLPDLENHQLQTVAAACGYELENHHHALADAEACAWIAREIL